MASIAWRAQARNTLESAGYEVRLAENGAHAWKALESAYFDVLVLDAGSDGGFELLDCVRTNSALSDLPVIWGGVSEDPSEREAALTAGATDYVWMCDRNAGRQLLDRIDRQLRGGGAAGRISPAGP